MNPTFERRVDFSPTGNIRSDSRKMEWIRGFRKQNEAESPSRFAQTSYCSTFCRITVGSARSVKAQARVLFPSEMRLAFRLEGV